MTSANGEDSSRVVLVTAPDKDTGKTIAHKVVEARLAACVNLVPGVTSIYSWEGAISEDEEVLLVIKTTADAVGELERVLVEIHPYDTPEFVALTPAHVEARYRDWLVGAVGPIA